MVNRSRFEMIADALRVLSHRKEGILKTHLMVLANLNAKVLFKEIIPILEENDLIITKAGQRQLVAGSYKITHYFITEKGAEFLNAMNKALKLLGIPPDTMFNKLDGR